MKSDDLKWNNRVVCIRNSPSFNNTCNFRTTGSCISLIIIFHLFWIEIATDFRIAPASNNMLFNHKNAMCFQFEINHQFDGWMDGLID